MTFEELEQSWLRQIVVGRPVSAELVQHTLVREVRGRSRRIQRIMGLAAFVFMTGCVTVAVTHFTGIKPLDPLSAAYLSVGLAFNLVFFVLAFRALRQNRQEAARMGETLLAAQQAALRALQRQMRDCRRLAYGLAAALFLATGFLGLKHASGLLPLAGLIMGTLLNLALTAGVGATLRRYYRRDLQPRQADLQQQLDSMHAGG